MPLQIAAERGLPALAIWLWFIVVLTLALVPALPRAAATSVLAAAALAAIAAMLAAGMFEYNFGDSEFLMLFLVIVTLPFAAGRRRTMLLPAVTPDRARAGSRRRPPARTILVIGDAMLDKFIVGRVTRISPEAPVPVVAFDHEMLPHRRRGQRGAQRRGARRTGDARRASPGRTTRRRRWPTACREAGIAPSLVGDASRPTTTKVRIVTERNQQVARIDYEADAEIADDIEQRVIAR